MKKNILILIFTALCQIMGLTAAADSHVEEYSLKTGDFSRLKVIDGINVDYIASTDSAGIVIFNATAQQASTIGFANKKGELTVSLTVNDISAVGRPTVRVYSTGLTSVENAGDSLVRIITVPACPTFSVKQIGNGRTVVRHIEANNLRANLSAGNGTIVINGTCDEASIKLAGTGTIQADNLDAKTVKVSAYGTGAVGCHPLSLLKIHGIGSTSIYYRGNPEIKNRAVGIKIQQLNVK